MKWHKTSAELPDDPAVYLTFYNMDGQYRLRKFDFDFDGNAMWINTDFDFETKIYNVPDYWAEIPPPLSYT